jgi:2-polyprenyl-3-methyl-5-hydroxy-6-metoxy-1,4-benzoquinol methylase
MRTLREAWTEIITVEDYEGHMAEIGQAKANAEMVRDFIFDLDLKGTERILFAGAGPGQMFDYIGEETFGGAHVVLTDINEKFVERLEKRAKQAGLTNFEVLIDDVESPNVEGPFDLVVLVLVLEHVDWQKALHALSALSASRFLIIVQRNPEGMHTAVSPNRTLRPSLLEAMKGEPSQLLDEQELIEFLTQLGYTIQMTDQELVEDGKLMCGYLFTKDAV